MYQHRMLRSRASPTHSRRIQASKRSNWTGLKMIHWSLVHKIGMQMHLNGRQKSRRYIFYKFLRSQRPESMRTCQRHTMCTCSLLLHPSHSDMFPWGMLIVARRPYESQRASASSRISIFSFSLRKDSQSDPSLLSVFSDNQKVVTPALTDHPVTAFWFGSRAGQEELNEEEDRREDILPIGHARGN